MKIKIISDSGWVYNPNSVMDAEELISDYREIEMLDPSTITDAAQLRWFNSLPTESQLSHIGEMWGIEYEIYYGLGYEEKKKC